MLKVKNLRIAISGKEILKGVSLVIKIGEIRAIMELNGSSKNTLNAVLAGNPIYKVT